MKSKKREVYRGTFIAYMKETVLVARLVSRMVPRALGGSLSPGLSARKYRKQKTK